MRGRRNRRPGSVRPGRPGPPGRPDRHHGRGRTFASAVAVRAGRIVAVGDDGAVRTLDRSPHPGRRPARTDGDAGVRRRPRPPDLRGPRSHAVRPRRAARARRVPAAIATYAATTRTSPGSAAAAGRWRTSRVASRIAPISTGSSPDRPVYLDEPRRPYRMGQLQGARARRRSPPRPRIPRTAGSSATRTAAVGRAPGGGDLSRRAPPPGQHAPRTRGRARLAQAELHRARHHPLAGRESSRGGGARIHVPRGPWRADRPRRRRAVVGARARRGTDRGARRARGPGPRSAGIAPTSVKFMQDGVARELHGAVLEPYLDADGRQTTTADRP